MATYYNDRSNFGSELILSLESSSTLDPETTPATSQLPLVAEEEQATNATAQDDNADNRNGAAQPLPPSQNNSSDNHETSLPSNSMTSSSSPQPTILTSAVEEALNRPSLGGLSATLSDDEDNDGFKTPTSADHRIMECPPAPRKAKYDRMTMMNNTAGTTRSTSVKRKIVFDSETADRDHEFYRHRRLSISSLSSCSSRRRILLDLSGEVEMMFPASVRSNFGCKIKKARTG